MKNRRSIFYLAVFIFLFVNHSAHAMPSFQEVKDSYNKSDAVLLDRHGKVIHKLRVDSKGRRLDWTGLKDISPALIKAVIYSEDRRFYEHHGVDWKAIGSTVIENIFSKTSRGASTITMQLVSILGKNLKPKGSKRTLWQKWKQINAAKEMEALWTKDEILEAYFNLITYRGELQGVSASSRGIFDKEPSGLDESEALILASLIPSPNASIEEIVKRACLFSNSNKSHVKCEDIKILAQNSLTGPYYIRQRTALAPHVAYILLKGGKESVVSTLDGSLQRFAADALRQHLMAVRKQNVNEGALLVVENKTGDILAYVGSAGNESSAPYVDGIKAKRQAGSTLKPFLYATAIEKRILTPGSILNDSPLDIPTTLGIYKPENYENDFKGMVSVRTALASSLNIPAVRTLSLIGVDTFVQRLRELGFGHLETDDHYGFSIALGSADVSLYELVNAYRTLANKGVWSELRLTFEKREKRHKRIFSEGTVFLITGILSDREARSSTFSLENPLSTRFWSAVKTGTSKDMRDNWCIGYSEKYTVGVWVGNFSGEPMWNVTGITGAAPVWLEIMNYLHHNKPSMSPRSPEGVIAKKINFQDGIEQGRNEWFRKGTEPIDPSTGETPVIQNTTNINHHITYPPEGTIIAIDPDIPEGQQVIFFEAQAQNKKFSWLLNNEKIGEFDTAISWSPKQGRHILSLVDEQDRVADSIEFEVR